MEQEALQVLGQKQLAKQVYELQLQGEMLGKIVTPGQFLHLKAPQKDLLLRRPISISSYDIKKKTATLIYRVEGKGTKLFTHLKKGDYIDVLGPLGHGFPVKELKLGETIFLIGGGIGIPPLYEIAKEGQKLGVKVISILGFATKEAIFYEEEFKKLGELHLTTEDGSYGLKGNVLDVVKTLGIIPDAVYACGPNGLLKAVDALFETHPRAYLSLESRMACGIGACYGCVVQEKQNPEKSKKVCDEGPVFPTGEVLFA